MIVFTDQSHNSFHIGRRVLSSSTPTYLFWCCTIFSSHPKVFCLDKPGYFISESRRKNPAHEQRAHKFLLWFSFLFFIINDIIYVYYVSPGNKLLSPKRRNINYVGTHIYNLYTYTYLPQRAWSSILTLSKMPFLKV